MKQTYKMKLINRKRIKTFSKNKLDYSINLKQTNNNIKGDKIITTKKYKKNKEICEIIVPIKEEEIIFINKNPKFSFKENIINENNNNNNEFNSIFEVFNSIIDKKPYLIISNKTQNLEIIDIENNKLINSLKGHDITITKIKYFLNKNNNKEYILSSSFKNIIIWDIQNNYNIQYKISINNNSFYIYNSILLFNIKKDNYIISSCNGRESTKIYSLNNRKFIKEIKNTVSNYTNYLLSWLNLKDNCIYIVEICKEKIYIYNITKDKLYIRLNSIYKGLSFIITCFENGFIYKDEFLCVSSIDGYICIYNLIRKEMDAYMKINGGQLFDIMQWDNEYVIVVDFKNNSIKIIDLSQLRMITDIKEKQSEGVKHIKKFYHPLYGNSLMTGSMNGSIKLWISC